MKREGAHCGMALDQGKTPQLCQYLVKLRGRLFEWLKLCPQILCAPGKDLFRNSRGREKGTDAQESRRWRRLPVQALHREQQGGCDRLRMGLSRLATSREQHYLLLLIAL